MPVPVYVPLAKMLTPLVVGGIKTFSTTFSSTLGHGLAIGAATYVGSHVLGSDKVKQVGNHLKNAAVQVALAKHHGVDPASEGAQ